MNLIQIINPSYRSKKWWKKRWKSEFDYSNILIEQNIKFARLLHEEREKNDELRRIH